MLDPRRVALEVLGEKIELLPEGCVHWPRRRSLILADCALASPQDWRLLARAVFDTRAERVLVIGEPRGAPPKFPAALTRVDGIVEDRFMFRQRPAAYPDVFVWCGHLQPRHWGRPAFYLRPETCILPDFGGRGEGLEVRSAPGERLYAIERGCVVEPG